MTKVPFAWQRAGLLAMVVAGCAAASMDAVAQDATPAPATRTDREIEVTGQRLPTAEAPRYAMCEALSRDPHFRALQEMLRDQGMPGVPLLAGTRLPRTPDWNAPPLSAPGSPIPDLGPRRFGQQRTGPDTLPVYADMTNPDARPSPFGDIANSRNAASERCISAYQPGANSVIQARSWAEPEEIPRPVNSPPSFVPAFNPGRMIRNDRTLPTAFWLFDQGRYQESLEWFRRAHGRLSWRTGGEEAALFIGKINLLAPGEWTDREAGVRWLKKAATARFNPAGDLPVFDPQEPERNTAVGEAAVILGNLYRTGIAGVAPDMEEARRWYDRALDVGHLAAAQVLGDMSFDGVGTDRDVREAVRYYRQAARFGLPAAQYALAQILEFGDDGVPRDLEEALGWYREAANAGHPGAQFALALAFDRGDGVPRNLDAALAFYKDAALQGHGGAMASLGTVFHEGEGVPQDLAAAREWFGHAAARGDRDGMVNLAVMTFKGEGGPADRVAAWQWLTRAVAARHERAPLMLAAVEAQMTPEERRALPGLTAGS